MVRPTAEAARLRELGDIPIDDVIALIDESPPDYRDLYYRWESEQWEAGAIDLSEDASQWQAFPEDLKRRLRRVLSSFYAGEEQVAQALVPFIDAAPTEEQQVFLSTQLVDGARHTVFFDRFYSDVLGDEGGDMRSRLGAQRRHLGDGFGTLFFEMLPAAAEKIRRDETAHAFVEGILLHHIVIEGTLAVTGRRFLLNFLRDGDLLPGFRHGCTAIARDGARHAMFGLRFLGDAVRDDVRVAEVIQRTLDELRPALLSALAPDDAGSFDPLPYGPEDLREYALRSLDRRVNAIGVELAT